MYLVYLLVNFYVKMQKQTCLWISILLFSIDLVFQTYYTYLIFLILSINFIFSLL